MTDGKSAEIGRQIALAGLALSQAAYLMDDLENGPTELSDLRYHLAKRKVVRLLSDTAHLATLFEIGDEETIHTAATSGLRIVPDAGDGESTEMTIQKKPRPSEVTLDELSWERSRLSAPHGLEIAEVPGGGVALRDADDSAGTILIASRWEWEAFAAAISTGQFLQLR